MSGAQAYYVHFPMFSPDAPNNLGRQLEQAWPKFDGYRDLGSKKLDNVSKDKQL